MRPWLTLVLSLGISAGGLATLGWATDGWTTWTAEAARRRALLSRHTTLPDVAVQRDTGKLANLHDFDSPVLVIDFIFTRCTTACMMMGYRFSQIQSILAAAGHAEKVRFLSISFDHEHDGPEQLSAYLRRFSPEPGSWSALKVTNKQALDELLDDLGVIILPEPDLGYVHNTALYLARDHEIVGIYDIDDTDEIIHHITSLI